jgi:hypothetical protein
MRVLLRRSFPCEPLPKFRLLSPSPFASAQQGVIAEGVYRLGAKGPLAGHPNSLTRTSMATIQADLPRQGSTSL